jgi:lysophospholipase L1-like esterase
LDKGEGKLTRLLLVGDSMIEFGDWAAYLPGREVHNLGRSGESVEELRERVERIIARPAVPDLVLLMIGTNNVAMQRFDFLAAYGDIIATLKAAWPRALLLVNSLMPMDLYYLAPGTVERVNDGLRRLADRGGAAYLDAWSGLVNPDGRPLAGVLADEVHLTERGYQLWAAVLREFMAGAEKGRA